MKGLQVKLFVVDIGSMEEKSNSTINFFGIGSPSLGILLHDKMGSMGGE